MPLRYLVLSAEYRRPFIISLLEYFQEIFDLLFGRYVQKPFIYDQHMIVGKFSNCTADAATGLLGKIEHLRQIRHAYVSAAVKVPAGLLPESAGQICLACTCETIDAYVSGNFYEASC